MSDAVTQFAETNYASLETYRKTGVAVKTPVWFAQDVSHRDPTITVFYVYSEAKAGKVKRIRNNSQVRVAPCNVRGTLRGTWVEGRARLCSDHEAEHGQELLRQKYGLIKRMGDFFGRLLRHEQVVIAIELL